MLAAGNPIVWLAVALAGAACSSSPSNDDDTSQGGAGGAGGAGGEGGASGASGAGGMGGEDFDAALEDAGDMGAGGAGGEGGSVVPDMYVEDAADMSPFADMNPPDADTPPPCAPGEGEAVDPDDPDGDCIPSDEDNCPLTRNENSQAADFDNDGLGDACDTDRPGVHDRYGNLSQDRYVCNVHDMQQSQAGLDLLMTCRDANQAVQHHLFRLPLAGNQHFQEPQADPRGEREQLSTKREEEELLVSADPDLTVKVIGDPDITEGRFDVHFDASHILYSSAHFIALSMTAQVPQPRGQNIAKAALLLVNRASGEVIFEQAFSAMGYQADGQRVSVQADRLVDLALLENGAAAFAFERTADGLALIVRGSLSEEPAELSLAQNQFAIFPRDKNLSGLVSSVSRHGQQELSALYRASEALEGAGVRYYDADGVEGRNTATLSLGAARVAGESNNLFYVISEDNELSLFDPATPAGFEGPVFTLQHARFVDAKSVVLQKNANGAIRGAALLTTLDERRQSELLLFEFDARGQAAQVRMVPIGWNARTLEMDSNNTIYVSVEANVWASNPNLEGNQVRRERLHNGEFNPDSPSIGSPRVVAVRWSLQDD